MKFQPFEVDFAGKPLGLVVNETLSSVDRVVLSQVEGGNVDGAPVLEVDRSTGDMFYAEAFGPLVEKRIGALPSAERRQMVAGLAAGVALSSAFSAIGLLFAMIFNPFLLFSVVLFLFILTVVASFIPPEIVLVLFLIGATIVTFFVMGILSRRDNLQKLERTVPEIHRAILIAIAPLLKNSSQPAEQLVALLKTQSVVSPQEVFISDWTINAVFSPPFENGEELLVALTPINAIFPKQMPERFRSMVASKLADELDGHTLLVKGPAHFVDSNIAEAQLIVEGGRDIGLSLIEAGLALPTFKGADELLRAGDLASARVVPTIERTPEFEASVLALRSAREAQVGIWSGARDVQVLAEGKTMAEYLGLLAEADLIHEPGVDA